MYIVSYSNKNEHADDYYPRITSARDNLGNIYNTEDRPQPTLNTKKILHPGDKIEFVITAVDPKGRELLYSYESCSGTEIQPFGQFSIEITDKDIGERFILSFMVSTQETYHRYRTYDDKVRFEYQVLPSRR